MVDLSNIVTRFHLSIFARVLIQLRIKFTVYVFVYFAYILHFVLCPHCYSKLSENFCMQL